MGIFNHHFFLYPCYDLRHGPDSNDGGVESRPCQAKRPDQSLAG